MARLMASDSSMMSSSSCRVKSLVSIKSFLYISISPKAQVRDLLPGYCRRNRARGHALRSENFCAAKRAAGIAPEDALENGRAGLRLGAKKRPARGAMLPGRAAIPI